MADLGGAEIQASLFAQQELEPIEGQNTQAENADGQNTHNEAIEKKGADEKENPDKEDGNSKNNGKPRPQGSSDAEDKKYAGTDSGKVAAAEDKKYERMSSKEIRAAKLEQSRIDKKKRENA